MKRIRTRNRIDTLANEQRASPIRWGKRAYFAILLGLGLLGINWAVGDAVILRADGLVTAARSVSGAIYPARVVNVLVRAGQHVRAGDVVIELESADMLRDLAQLTAQNADLALREVQVRTRVMALAALLPLADRHARESASVRSQLDRLAVSGLVSSQRRDQALGTEYDAAARLAGLQAEAGLLGNELPTVVDARRQAGERLRQLGTFYDSGRVRAARDGIIGAQVPAQGQVVKVGDDLLQVFSAETSVVAYLPDIYLFTLQPGDQVTLTGGSISADGVIEALLGVTDALPQEFQSTFRPRDRSRIVRVRLAAGSGFALSQKVQVRGCAMGWCWRTHPASDLVATLWQRLVKWA